MIKKALKTTGVCLAAIAAGVVAQLTGLAAGELLGKAGLPQITEIIVSAILYPLLTFIGIKLIVGKAFKYDLKSFRIGKPDIKLYWLGAAIILPLTVTAVYQFTNGHWIMCNTENTSALILTAQSILWTGLAAGISEELIFRGAIMGAIEKEYNRKAAVLIPSIAFAAVHIAGRSLSLRSILLLMAAGTLVGVMFSLIEIQSGSFWNNAMVHAGWNTIILGILHTDAKPSSDSVFTYVLDSKSELLTGGDFGIESSLVAVIAYSVVIVMAFALMAGKRHQPQLRKSINY